MNITLNLNEPGMTALHKVGLAGLTMTLQVFELKNVTIPGLCWTIEPTRLVLTWNESYIRNAFESLIKKSYWVDAEGFIRFAGLEPSVEPSAEQKHQLYTALLNSFLQFGPHRPTGAKKTYVYTLGGDETKPCFIKDFAPVKQFRHQTTVDDFVDDNGNFRTSVDAAGWLFPGGGQRHVAYPVTKLNEPLSHALALLFAPVGAIYSQVQSKTKGRKARLALLLPQVTDLVEYAEMRRALATTNSLSGASSSASDAVLRMLVALDACRRTRAFAQQDDNFVCRVITFGIVSWNEKQKSRTHVNSIFSGRVAGFEHYRKAYALFGNTPRKIPARVDRKGRIVEPERYFISVSCVRELIADNIASGKYWYSDLSTFLGSKEVRERIQFEREGLVQMVEASLDENCERRFVDVCHESWRRRLGKLRSRADNSGIQFRTLVRKEAEKLRTSISRCRNAETLRETVVDFWARGGIYEQLQGGSLPEIMRMFDESNWKKARDLALLALISYKPQTNEEDNALNSDNDIEGDENE